MTKKQLFSNILILLFLSVLTVGVYAYPNFLPSLVEKISSLQVVNKGKSSSSGHDIPLFATFGKIQSYDSYIIESLIKSEITLDGSMLPGESNEIETIQGSLLSTGVSIVDGLTDSEINQFSLETSFDLRNGEESVSRFSYNPHITLQSLGSKSFAKLHSGKLKQSGQTLPAIVLWYGLLNELTGTWLSGTFPILAVNHRFTQNTTNIRFLEVDKDSTFIEFVGEGFQFSGDVKQGVLNGGFTLPKQDITGMISSRENNSNDYTISLQFNAYSGAQYSGILSIDDSKKHPTISLQGGFKRGSSLHIIQSAELHFKKTQKATIPALPQQYRDFQRIKQSIFGIEETKNDSDNSEDKEISN